MIEYLLDSDIAIYIMNQSHPRPVQQMATAAGHVGISAIAYAELAFGVHRSDRQADNMAALDAFIKQLQVFPFGPEAAVHYGQIRAELQRAGTPIGANDMLIAAHARSLGAILVTNNRREFDRVPGLLVENWV